MIKALRGKWLAVLCLLPFALFFIAFQVAPLLWVASNSLNASDGWGLGNFREAFASPFYRQAIRHSLEVSFWSSLIGISIAILGSYSLRQVSSRQLDIRGHVEPIETAYRLRRGTNHLLMQAFLKHLTTDIGSKHGNEEYEHCR